MLYTKVVRFLYTFELFAFVFITERNEQLLWKIGSHFSNCFVISESSLPSDFHIFSERASINIYITEDIRNI